MDHISPNIVNFFEIGLMASLFIGGGLFVLIWLSSVNLPIISPVAKVVTGIVHKIP